MKGRTYLFYSISTFVYQNSAFGLTSAGVILTSKDRDAYNAIDSNLVIDQSGNPWLAFGFFWTGLKIVALAPSTMLPKGDIISIAARSNSDAIEIYNLCKYNFYLKYHHNSNSNDFFSCYIDNTNLIIIYRLLALLSMTDIITCLHQLTRAAQVSPALTKLLLVVLKALPDLISIKMV